MASREPRGPEMGTPMLSARLQLPNEAGPLEIPDSGRSPRRKRKSLKRRSLMLFERASSKWWNPQFAYAPLERQFWENCFPQLRVRFRWGLLYVIATCLSWFFFHLTLSHWEFVMTFQVGCMTLTVSLIIILCFTFCREHYARFYLPTSFIVTFLIYVLSLLFFTLDPPILSSVGAFVCSIEVVLVLYTIIPLPLYVSIVGGLSYSILYEVISLQRTYLENDLPGVKFMLHLCIHLIGTQIFIIGQVRERKTLLKVGESLMSQHDLKTEKEFNEQMLESVMPKGLKKAFLDPDTGMRRPSVGLDTIGKTGKVFRPFQMSWLENVSILFADIAGFTKMSSNKSADELVDLLKDLFGRFDRLCTQFGCEKISTLGDCYYCVAGCPEPVPDHAERCVEMGLAMVSEIIQFDKDRGQDVSMRVGIHTGSVMNGIVGSRRFKYDVFSNDVTCANMMESTGRAGAVHISEKTASFLKDQYVLEEGELYKDKTNFKTYFVIDRRPGSQRSRQALDAAVRANEVTSITSPSWNGNGDMTGSAELPVWCPGRIRHIDSSELDTRSELSRAFFNATVSQPASSCYAQKRTPSPSGRVSPSPAVAPAQLPSGRSHSLRTRVLSAQFQSGVANRLMKPRKSISMVTLSEVAGDGQPLMNAEPTVVSVSVRPRSFLSRLTPPNGGYGSSAVPLTSLLADGSRDDLRRGQGSDSRPTQAMDSLVSMTRVDDRTDKRIADYLAEAHRPLVKHLEAIDQWTLRFKEPLYEGEYRNHFRGAGKFCCKVTAPKYSVVVDVAVASIVYAVISLVTFWVFGTRHMPWVVYFCLASLILGVFLVYFVYCLARLEYLMSLVTHWWPRHMVSFALLLLPAGAVYTNLHCDTGDRSQFTVYYIAFVVLFAFCNFSQLSNWLKSLLALLIGATLVLIANVIRCPCSDGNAFIVSNETSSTTLMPVDAGAGADNTATLTPTRILPFFTGDCVFRYELIMVTLLAFLLITFLNRQFESIFRLSFYGDVKAVEDMENQVAMKEQADWLLSNIIPPFVLERLKVNLKYSENHDCVAVLFASIVNWHDMYEESYQGGMEFLRVLNEVIGDFDELLDRPEFSQIEKIKTIGSTYMAASGLNPKEREHALHPMAHLYDLMNFAIALQEALDNFNKDLLNFAFVMKLGFNIGPVTAGVIGTTKLYYDIWGDTVNIASRMYSNGVKGRIQVSERVKHMLEDRFEFEFRDHIEVKGIDSGMDVYLLKGRRV